VSDPEASAYIHGTSSAEQRRLATMNEILNRGSIREIGLSGGERVLDLGCGTGQLSRLLARAAGPSGRVVAIDRSGEQLAEAASLAREAGEAPLVEFRQGAVGELPLTAAEWGSFDVAHARFLLEHVPDPLAVVREMVRAVRPGGRIVIEDDDHDLLRLHPEAPAVAETWRAYQRSYDRNGNDPYVGRRLVSLLHQAGAEPRRTTWIFFGACAGDPLFAPCCDNLSAILAGARAAILATGFGPDAFAAAIDSLRAFRERPDASFGYAMPWAEGVRPG
jgi:ubiquinone/menaquinone biosynthesis C-methylase UbiE